MSEPLALTREQSLELSRNAAIRERDAIRADRDALTRALFDEQAQRVATHLHLDEYKESVRRSGVKIADLTRQLAEAQEHAGELQALFDLQHTRTVEADTLWRVEHNKPRTIPDLEELIAWLLTFRTKLADMTQERDALKQARHTQLSGEQ